MSPSSEPKPIHSTFLHSSQWESLVGAVGGSTKRHQDLLYQKKSLLFGKHYWYLPRFSASTVTTAQPEAGQVFLRIEPADPTTLSLVEKEAALHHYTLVPTLAVQPRQTVQVDLLSSQTDRTASYSSKHRYNLRVAQRSGLSIDIISKDLETHWPRFWKLLQETSMRHGFTTHSEQYYRQMLTVFTLNESIHLCFARRENVDLACLLLLEFNQTCYYLHGASTSHAPYRSLMAPYLLHHTAMQFAAERGNCWYDFWGIDAVEMNGTWKAKEGEGSAGTTRFKLGFGGKVVNYPGTFDMIISPFWYTLYTLIRRFRSRNRDFS
jgi:peptidoglycan pentaglycine glycine transferase (the first glycine)